MYNILRKQSIIILIGTVSLLAVAGIGLGCSSVGPFLPTKCKLHT